MDRARIADRYPTSLVLISLTERELVVSVNTVRAQRRSVCAKLQVTNRASALAKARDLGLH